MKGIIVLVSWAIAALVFYLAFFVAAPAIAALIPAGDWKAFLDLVIYFFIAWVGGIGIPLGIGTIVTVTALK